MSEITRAEILACRPCHALDDDVLDEARGNAYLDSVGMTGRESVTAQEIADAETVSLEYRVWILTAVLAARSPQQAREFACDCADSALASVPESERDPRSVQAIEVARRFARGDSTKAELAAAWAAAWDAAWAAAWAAQLQQLVDRLETSGSHPAATSSSLSSAPLATA